MLGFSVLGNHFYRSLTAIAHSRISVDAFSLGGHNFTILPAIMDRILARDDYDMVLLDMLTPDFRKWVNIVEFERYLRAILYKISIRGLKVGFIHLHRFDVDPKDDPIRAICDIYSDRYDLPIIDFAQRHIPELGDEGATYVPDGVHFSELGAQWAAGIVVMCLEQPGFLQLGANLPGLEVADNLLRHCSFNMAELGVAAPSEPFAGYGVHWPVSIFAQDHAVTIPMPPAFFGIGVFFVNGPRSGDVKITVSGAEPIILRIHDAKSYFQRMFWRPVPIDKAGHVTFCQVAGRPDVVLDKGTPVFDDRLLKLALVTGISLPAL